MLARKLPLEVATAAPTVSNGGRTYKLPDPPRVSLFAAIRPTGHRRRVPARDRADAASALELVRHRRSSVPSSAPGVHPGRADTIAGVRARGDRLTIRLTRPDPTLTARLSTSSFRAVPPNTPIRPRGLERIAAVVHSRRRVDAGQSPPAAAQSQLRRSAPATPRGDRGRVRRGAGARPCPRSKPGVRTTPRAIRRKPRLGCLLATGPAAVPRPRAASGTFASPRTGHRCPAFNSRRSLFARAAMRRAVNYAIDRRALGARAVRGTRRPAD